MKVIDIENIKIPSINGKFGFSRITGKPYLNKEYRDFKKLISNNARLYFSSKQKPPYSVHVQVQTSLDVDNFLKCALDGLQASGIIDDDKNILRLIVDKYPIKRGKPGSLKIYVESLEEVEHVAE